MPSWVPLGNPNLPAGQADNTTSAPVVFTGEQEAVLVQIERAVRGLASAIGSAADLRVTFSPNALAAQTLPVVSSVTSITTLSQVGGIQANAAVSNWQNQTAILGFNNNIGRS